MDVLEGDVISNMALHNPQLVKVRSREREREKEKGRGKKQRDRK